MVFLTQRLISFNKILHADFIKHIENTDNLCLYKLGSHYIPQNIYFPKAKSLTLINCNKSSILNIFYPNIFPNLTSVNYLSVNPGDFKIHERYNNLKWIFPNKTYEFYDFMVENGHGMKDSELINRYIKNKKIIDGKNGFDISFEFDLNIPGYGIVNGNWYQSQFYEYLVKKQNDLLSPQIIESTNENIPQELEELELQKEYVKEKIANAYFEDIIKNEY
jgi:hypothetical protein